MKLPSYEYLEKLTIENRAVGFNQNMHPNPRYYKYYWHVFSKDSEVEGKAFLGDKYLLSTYEANKEVNRLNRLGLPYMLYNYSLPREGDDTPFNESKSKHWAPSYDEDTDCPLGKDGFK